MIKKGQRINIEFYDSVTGDWMGSFDSELKTIDLLRNKHTKHVRLFKQTMTNTYRRLGMLIGDIRTKVKVYTPKI